MELNPNQDWRIQADKMKDAPLCKNCGRPYGNVYFGASHYCPPEGKTNYEPVLKTTIKLK